MTIKFVYKILPVLVRYGGPGTRGFAGFSYGPYIRIAGKYKGDEGLLRHELTHSRQFYRTFGLWGLLYKSKKLRYKYELEAYAVQLSVADQKDRERLAGTFAMFMADKYGLSINEKATKQLLLNKAK